MSQTFYIQAADPLKHVLRHREEEIVQFIRDFTGDPEAYLIIRYSHRIDDVEVLHDLDKALEERFGPGLIVSLGATEPCFALPEPKAALPL